MGSVSMLRDSGDTDTCADSDKSREGRMKSARHLRRFQTLIRNH